MKFSVAVAGAHGRNVEDLICRVNEGGQGAMAAIVSATSLNAEALGLKASQDMLQAQPDLSVIVGADQAITGAVVAVGDNPTQIALVGYGGGAARWLVREPVFPLGCEA